MYRVSIDSYIHKCFINEVKPSLSIRSQLQQKVSVMIDATNVQVCDTAVCCGVG